MTQSDRRKSISQGSNSPQQSGKRDITTTQNRTKTMSCSCSLVPPSHCQPLWVLLSGFPRPCFFAWIMHLNGWNPTLQFLSFFPPKVLSDAQQWLDETQVFFWAVGGFKKNMKYDYYKVTIQLSIIKTLTGDESFPCLNLLIIPSTGGPSLWSVNRNILSLNITRIIELRGFYCSVVHTANSGGGLCLLQEIPCCIRSWKILIKTEDRELSLES